MNIEYLKEKLYDLAIGSELGTDHTIVTNARHHDALRRADGALSEVLQGLNSGVTGDFVAQDIRHALAYLGEITGGDWGGGFAGEYFWEVLYWQINCFNFTRFCFDNA